MREVKKRRALPVYIAAAVFALYALVAPLYTLWHFFFAAVVTAATWLAADAVIKPEIEYIPEPKPSYGEAADAILARAEAFREAASGFAAAMGADGEKLMALADLSDTIAEKAKEPTADFGRIRRFQDYYLATTEKLAAAYVRLAAQGSAGGNISDSRSKISAMLDAEKQAYSRFLDALFGAEAMDIDSEIQVMRMRMRAEGLTEGGDGPDELLKKAAETSD